MPKNEGGKRIDNRSLIQEWKNKMKEGQLNAKYVTNLSDFRSLKPKEYEHLLSNRFYNDRLIKKDNLAYNF